MGTGSSDGSRCLYRRYWRNRRRRFRLMVYLAEGSFFGTRNPHREMRAGRRGVSLNTLRQPGQDRPLNTQNFFPFSPSNNGFSVPSSIGRSPPPNSNVIAVREGIWRYSRICRFSPSVMSRLMDLSTRGSRPRVSQSGYFCLSSRTFVSGTPITKLPKTLSRERDTTLKYRFSRGISECWLKTANFATC
jgi:hypothetical protein